MKIYRRVPKLVDIGPMNWVLVIGPEGTKARLRMKMKTVCAACGKKLVEGDSLCAGMPAKPQLGNLILHEKCLDEQARSVIRKPQENA